MRKIRKLVNWCLLLLFIAVNLYFPFSAQAFTITSDPQYLVMNFSTINELNWAAPETEWQTTIKPQVKAQIDELQAALPPGTDQRKLAWSTLMEYMNFPLDEAGPDSPYVIKVRRIFEVAEEENLPVFIPLNGFQWWDELPELYNWWDPDGTKTPTTFFERQDNPEDFKRRFIAGYDPENRWNVEWQDYQTPMNLNWRNWGGGGFRLAPPPNVIDHEYKTTRPDLTYRKVLDQRLTAILTQIAASVDELATEGKTDLFAGLTIGTEVSLNASATPKDEFEPYGYRAIQDHICKGKIYCELLENLSDEEIHTARQQIVRNYLTGLTRQASKLGIPKQRIYTHVWGEAKVGEPRYVDYAAASQVLYARPGMSFYGYAEDPYSLPVWQAAQTQHGQPNWGAVEYSADKNAAVWQRAMANVLGQGNNARVPAKVIVLYNWGEHKDTPAMPALKDILEKPVINAACELSEILPITENLAADPAQLEWSYLNEEAAFPSALKLHFHKGLVADVSQPPLHTIELNSDLTTAFLPPEIKSGVYSWYVETIGCAGTRKQFSEPRVVTKSLQVNNEVPRLVKWWLER